MERIHALPENEKVLNICIREVATLVVVHTNLVPTKRTSGRRACTTSSKMLPKQQRLDYTHRILTEAQVTVANAKLNLEASLIAHEICPPITILSTSQMVTWHLRYGGRATNEDRSQLKRCLPT